MKKIIRHSLQLSFLAVLVSLLSACGLFGDKDNTPKPAALVKFTPGLDIAQRWSTSTGSGNNGKFLRLQAAYSNGIIFTASNGGNITAVNAKTGEQIWQTNTHANITAGASANEGYVAVGTDQGHVIVVSAKNGHILWQQNVSSVVLAAPTISGDSVYVKTIDGKLCALNLSNGHQQWTFSQDVPALILRGSSAATVDSQQVYAGFANGNLVSLSTNDGSVTWQQTIAVATGANDVENMIDIDAAPIVQQGIVYVVSYQGNLAALNATTGTPLWQHKFSSYSGLSVSNDAVYASDTSGHVWAFDASTGSILWHQDALSWRNITAPVMMGNHIIVGDQEGYLHWLSPKDGHFLARIKVGSAIMARPVVINKTAYVFTANGKLAAYQVAQ